VKGSVEEPRARGDQSTGHVLWRDNYRLTMGDVDAAGIVHYVNPYRWRDTAYTGWLLSIGRPLSGLLAAGTVTPCVMSTAQYLRPLRLDDVVALTLVVERVGRTSFDLRMDAFGSNEELAVQVRTRNVWTVRSADGLMSPVALPAWLREALAE
jgi:acyl-CoA thioester hydrolase